MYIIKFLYRKLFEDHYVDNHWGNKIYFNLFTCERDKPFCEHGSDAYRQVIKNISSLRRSFFKSCFQILQTKA